jgi:signal transduction histidine kinase
MPEQFGFRISSALKNIIGKELITNDFIAIFELVKNSYDAGAKSVEIIFQNVKEESQQRNSKIIIRDDGDGMSLDDLKTKWLVVGYSEKKEIDELLKLKDYREKIGSKRIFAGAKGIGRFSCDRLGKKLTLYTKKADDKLINVLDIDWSKFEENSKADFQTVKVDYEARKELNIKIAPKGLINGTILEITGLNNTWDYKKLQGLKRHLQRLINPTQVNKPQDFTIRLEALDYLSDDKEHKSEEDNELVNGTINNVVFEKLGIKTTYIHSTISDDGEKITTELFDKDRFIFRLTEKNEYPSLKNINIWLFYLNKAAKTTFTKIMGIQPVRYGSVFLYKNGFKISPYGDEGDDWLGLDRRKTQGIRRYLANRELIGRIEISGYQPAFNEVSSRDGGVVKTNEFTLLTQHYFMEKVLRRLERYVVEGLDWDNPSTARNADEINSASLKIIDQIVGQVKDEHKALEFNKDLLEIYSEKQTEESPEVIRNIENLKNFVQTKEDKDYIDKQARVVEGALREFRIKHAELQEEIKKKEGQIAFIERHTDESVKDVIGLEHHIRNATSIMKAWLKRLKEQTGKDKYVSSAYVSDVIDKLTLQVMTISSVAVYATHATFDVRQEKTQRDLIGFIKQYIENAYILFNKERLEFENVAITVKTSPNVFFDFSFTPLDFIIIIDNMIDNSRKAKAHNLEITLAKKGDSELIITFKDDGKGIAQKDLNGIFSFGFSTTGGTGIGLYQIRKLVSKYGDISFNTNLQKGAEFTIMVKK